MPAPSPSATAPTATAAGPLLRLRDLVVRYGEQTALDSADLDVAPHEIVCLLGPSGSGKSTLLRAVAGLQPVSHGQVLLSGADLRGVPTHRRDVGLMFQDHQLFPQRDVARNVSFGLRVRGAGRSERREAVAELLELVGLPGAQERAVATLSGGEQQRVALARALAPRPRLLMLDEPMGQLDRRLRERLVVELRALFRRLGTTVLAVTHDQAEAFALADRVLIMNEGRIVQSGTPQEVWQAPATEFVARFLGFENIVDATVRDDVADTPWGPVPVPQGTPPGECRLMVRPAGVRVVAPSEGPACMVAAGTFRGGHMTLLLDPEGGGPRLEAACAPREAPAEGERVGVCFRAEDVVRLGS